MWVHIDLYNFYYRSPFAKVEEVESTESPSGITTKSSFSDWWEDGDASEWPAEWRAWDVWVPVADDTPQAPLEDSVKPEPEISVPKEPESPVVKPVGNENDGDDLWGFGWLWDPVNGMEVPLVEIGQPRIESNGTWSVQCKDDAGISYEVTVNPKKPDTNATKKALQPQEAGSKPDERIRYEPVREDNFAEFSFKAWGGDASGSSGAAAPKDHQEPCVFGPKKKVLECQLKQALGEKPCDNHPSGVLPLDSITNMTLAEHITHVKWYKSPGDCKQKIPNEIPDQLWQELVEIFVLYHAHGMNDPETVHDHLKTCYAQKFLGL